MNRERFPGLRDGWARLDGPAGTQMVDTAIEAMAGWMRSGKNANHGGVFYAGRANAGLWLLAAALATDVLVCSPCKRLGPHAGVLCASPELLAELAPDFLGLGDDGAIRAAAVHCNEPADIERLAAGEAAAA